MVHVPLPDIGGRRQIIAHYLAEKRCAPSVDAEALARGTSGFSGAELANLINMAAIRAAVTGARALDILAPISASKAP